MTTSGEREVVKRSPKTEMTLPDPEEEALVAGRAEVTLLRPSDRAAGALVTRLGFVQVRRGFSGSADHRVIDPLEIRRDLVPFGRDAVRLLAPPGVRAQLMILKHRLDSGGERGGSRGGTSSPRARA